MGIKGLIIVLLVVSVLINVFLVVILFSEDVVNIPKTLMVCNLDSECVEGFECEEDILCDGNECYSAKFCQSNVVLNDFECRDKNDCSEDTECVDGKCVWTRIDCGNGICEEKGIDKEVSEMPECPDGLEACDWVYNYVVCPEDCG